MDVLVIMDKVLEVGSPFALIMSIVAILAILLIVSVVFFFIYQLRKAISEDFKSRGRNVAVGILGLATGYILYAMISFGFIAYKAKHKIGYKVQAYNMENMSCVEAIIFFEKGEFTHKKICDKKESYKGKFTIEGDTIFIHDVKLKRKSGSFYEYAIIGKKQGDDKAPLTFYKNSLDNNPRKFDIEYIDN